MSDDQKQQLKREDRNKGWLQVVGALVLLTVFLVDAFIPTFEPKNYVYWGAIAFMLGARPETLFSMFGIGKGKQE